MNRHRFSLVAVGVAAALTTSFISFPAFAQDELEETVVTATRTPVPLDAVGAPVIVISRNDIERSMASDVSELLQGRAGLEISRNGGPGQTTSLFMRGTDSNHTVVLVDGVRINPGTIGGAALQNIAPESIERIEIVKGPRSALYGTDAIGGVVQLFTRGAAREGLSAGATYGSDATQQLFADGAVNAGEKTRFGFGGSYSESDGMPVFLDSSSDRGYRNVTGRASMEIAATDALTLRGRAWRAEGRTEYAEQDFFSGDFLDRSNDFETSVYSAEAEYRGTRGLGLRLTANQANDDIDQLQPNFDGDDSGLDFAHTRRNSAGVQVDLPELASHALSLGVQFSDENTDAKSFDTVFDENTSVTQVFVQDQFELGPLTSRLAVGGVDHETFGSEVTWNAEVGMEFDTGTRVTLSGGKAFRAPDSTDRFGFGGNADLQPEVSRQVEVTVRQKLGHRQLLTLSAFDNRIRDLINFFVIDPNTFRGENRNIDRARIKGVELGWAFTGAAWRARAELTLQDPRDAALDTRLLRRARETLSFAVDRDVGPFDVGVDVVASGNRKDFGFPTVTLDSYALVNATVRYRMTSQLTLQSRLENLLDEHYSFADGYRTEGRAWTVGVRYSFE
ncbi:MAG TPA: TonB-dependent receptor [Steroidobacteraceae bacterium]|nr:TonB-dependent receptor [Steroidobacteraceae bacterium]